MHEIEPFFNWRHLYDSEEDELSPFYGREHSEFEFSQTIYNYYIHPQWDDFGSKTLYLKVIYADYEKGFAIIELLGEWNDAIENDIMELKREVIDSMIENGIRKFILIGENVLNFHSSDDSYYEEWLNDIEEDGGWIVLLNMPEQSLQDFRATHLEHYIFLMQYLKWRTHKPEHLFQMIEEQLMEGPKLLE